MNVLKEQCATCIFRPGNPMRLQAGRVKDMVTACIRRDVYIPCHEHMTIDVEKEPDSDGVVQINPRDPVCRGFYDRYPGVGQMIRIAGRLGMIKFVEGNKLAEGAP